MDISGREPFLHDPNNSPPHTGQEPELGGKVILPRMLTEIGMEELLRAETDREARHPLREILGVMQTEHDIYLSNTCGDRRKIEWMIVDHHPELVGSFIASQLAYEDINKKRVSYRDPGNEEWANKWYDKQLRRDKFWNRIRGLQAAGNLFANAAQNGRNIPREEWLDDTADTMNIERGHRGVFSPTGNTFIEIMGGPEKMGEIRDLVYPMYISEEDLQEIKNRASKFNYDENGHRME